MSPSPATGSALLRLSLGLAETVRLSVYGCGGRAIRRTGPFALTAGEHDFIWDGRDGDGSPLVSGIYFVGAGPEGREIRRTVVLIRLPGTSRRDRFSLSRLGGFAATFPFGFG